MSKPRLFLIAGTWGHVGGLEIVTFDVAKVFVSLGWDVDVFPVFTVSETHDTDGVVLLTRPPQMRFLRSLWLRGLWMVFLLIRLLFAKERPSAVLFGHAHYLPILPWVKRVLNVPFFVWTHGIEVWGERGCKWSKLLNKLDHIVAVSQYTARQMRVVGVTVPITVIPNSVDCAFFCPAPQKEDIRRDEILICGRISATRGSKVQYKGHDVLFEALPLAERQLGRPLRIRVVGAGDDVERLKRVAQNLQIRDRVCFAGKVSLKELIEDYQRCGVFCMPSRVNQNPTGYWTGEGFGIVYIEAAACARPVIASCEGGASETIAPDITGKLVDPRSAESVAKAIVEFLSDPVQSDEMGRAGRRWVEQHFSREIFAQNIAKFVKRLCNTCDCA